MIKVVNVDDIVKLNPGKTGHELIGEADGCLNGCRCGVSIYTRDEYDYNGANAHEDQEGFLVLDGKGYALIGDEEIVLKEGTCFVIPAGVKHAMKKDKNYDSCKVFWFHSAT